MKIIAKLSCNKCSWEVLLKKGKMVAVCPNCNTPVDITVKNSEEGLGELKLAFLESNNAETISVEELEVERILFANCESKLLDQIILESSNLIHSLRTKTIAARKELEFREKLELSIQEAKEKIKPMTKDQIKQKWILDKLAKMAEGIK